MEIENVGGNGNRNGNDSGFVQPNTCIDRFAWKISSEFRIVNGWPISLGNAEPNMA
jgi:hypothetical protein